MADMRDLEGNRVERRKWCCGVLNDKDIDEVPGTVLLLTGPPQAGSEDDSSRLKRTPDGKFVLNPQPQESPNDPLNWPIWKRTTALFILGFYCMLGGGLAALLAAGFQDVGNTFHVSVEAVALTTGFYLLGLGLGGVFMSPMGIIYGKRTVYLGTALLLVASSVWCAISPSYPSLVAARIVQGLAVSPVEVLASATVSELFFSHERAFRLGIYTMLLLSGKNLMPLVAAAVISVAGWRWVFWTIVFCVGLALVFMFFLLPESYWDRSLIPPSGDDAEPKLNDADKGSVMMLEQVTEISEITTTVTSTKGIKTDGRPETETEMKEEIAPTTTVNTTEVVDKQVSLVRADYTARWQRSPEKTYPQTLAIYSGRMTSNESWFLAAVRPFVLYAYPAILWSALVYSLSLGWLIVLSESVSKIYRNQETYDFTSLEAGLVYISPFVGAVLGTAVAGKISDLIVRFMAARNNGYMEPEFRLVMAIPVAFATTIGLMGFGWAAQVRDAWIVPTIFFGIIGFGCSLGGTLAITYAVDSYRQYAAESLVTLNFSKNILHGFTFSLFFPHWLEEEGSKKVFIALGCIQIICMLATIPMFIYGKRARMWTVRKDMMARFSAKKVE